jgi:hypothetical protein
MAYAKDTIKLGAARAVFEGVDFQEVLIGGEVCGYRAEMPDGTVLENAGLTKLCQAVWAHARNH